jgi:hypothetical protein
MRYITCLLILLGAAASLPGQSLDGVWDARVTVNGEEIPFCMELAGGGHKLRGYFFNGDEKLESTSGSVDHGAVVLKFDYYLGKLEATLKDGHKGTYTRPRVPV